MPALAVKERLHGRTNDRVRDILDNILIQYPAGHVVTVDYLTHAINLSDARRNFSNERTGRLLSERSDIKQVLPGIWRVI